MSSSPTKRTKSIFTEIDEKSEFTRKLSRSSLTADNCNSPVGRKILNTAILLTLTTGGVERENGEKINNVK